MAHKLLKKMCIHGIIYLYQKYYYKKYPFLRTIAEIIGGAQAFLPLNYAILDFLVECCFQARNKKNVNGKL